MAEALAFAAEGKVKADIELQPLSAINEVFTRLPHGEVPSRVVLDFASALKVRLRFASAGKKLRDRR